MVGISGMSGMLGMLRISDIKCHTFLKSQPQADLNDDGNFRNGGNFRNVENVRNVIP